MRLLTHNMLQCHVKGCNVNNFPLKVEAGEIQNSEADFNPAFIKAMLPKLDWTALKTTCDQLSIDSIPSTLPEEADQNDEFFQLVHHILLETIILEGKLVCSNCGHEYTVKKGVPNMLLCEDEV
eukprot:Sdes_comp9430_c0_seq1m893